MTVKSHHIHKLCLQLWAEILGFTLEFCYHITSLYNIDAQWDYRQFDSILIFLHFCWVIIIVLFHKTVWIKCGHKYNTGLPCSSNGKQSACNTGDLGLILGLGRPSREGNGSPLQYSFLENPMDRGAWRATVHWVTKSWTWLSDLTHTHKCKVFAKVLEHSKCYNACRHAKSL